MHLKLSHQTWLKIECQKSLLLRFQKYHIHCGKIEEKCFDVLKEPDPAFFIPELLPTQNSCLH